MKLNKLFILAVANQHQFIIKKKKKKKEPINIEKQLKSKHEVPSNSKAHHIKPQKGNGKT